MRAARCGTSRAARGEPRARRFAAGYPRASAATSPRLRPRRRPPRSCCAATPSPPCTVSCSAVDDRNHRSTQHLSAKPRRRGRARAEWIYRKKPFTLALRDRLTTTEARGGGRVGCGARSDITPYQRTSRT